ncbi:DUF3307 domain-containing protein [Pseudooceanicola sp. LIPI14-2-Ac024]|uniref:DUF3307 domain-containing protein n=1 Tax=Pseudooceanicola sp. LIPI14-2-Ac024 TaxID=3344875 RepID=UPI0035D0697E
MIETVVALLFAHVLADFLFQTNAMVANKRRLPVLLLHVAIVAGLSLAALGGSPLLILGVALAHLVIDAIKVRLLPDTLTVFLLDQAAHVAVILAAAWFAPDAFATGLWGAMPPDLIRAEAAVTGLILATFAGGPAVGLLMRGYDSPAFPDGLPNGGRMIGLLERTLIVLLVMVGEPAGIGFLIAAKSILRFDMASESRVAGEYVIIGTLASFAWALVMAFGTQYAFTLLPG